MLIGQPAQQKVISKMNGRLGHIDKDIHTALSRNVSDRSKQDEAERGKEGELAGRLR